MHSDNPAARLLKILEDGKNIPPTNNCRKAWQELLDVNSSEPALLMYRLGKVMELPDLIIRDVTENYPNQANSHEHWSSKISAGFMHQNLNANWQEFIQYIDSHTISYLSMSADLLDMKASTKLMNTSEIVDIRGKIENLLNEAVDLDCNPPLNSEHLK